MSESPKLEVGANKGYTEDLKLFRIGSFRAWAEFGQISGKVPLVSVNISFADSGLPTARIDVPAGTPFGAMRLDTSYANYTFSDLKKFDTVTLYLEIPELDVGSSDHVGPAIDPGKYLMFKGLVSNIATTIDRESGVYSARLTLAHEVATSLSTGTLLFGAFAPFTFTHVYSRDHIMDDAADATKTGAGSRSSDIIEAGGNIDGSDMWSDWMAPAFKAYYKPTKVEDPTEPKLKVFSDFSNAAFKRMSAAIDQLSGTLPIKKTSNDLLRVNMFTQVNIGTLLPGKIDSTNALAVLMDLSEQLSFSVLCRPDGIILLPYWPFRKLETMRVLRAGSAVSVEDVRSVMTTRGSVVGGLAMLTPVGPEDRGDAAISGSDVVAAQILDLSGTLQEAYVTVDQETIPEFLLNTHINTEPEDDGSQPEVGSIHDPVTEDNEATEYGIPVDEGIADEYTRYRLWEKWLGPNIMQAAMPLRLDITPGLVVRMDNRITYENEELQPDEASYAYVKGVTVSISGAGNTAGMAVTFSHLHTYEEQQILEKAEVAPILYDESALEVLDGLQLFDKVS